MKTIIVREKLTPEILQQIKTEDCEVIVSSSLISSRELETLLNSHFGKNNYTVSLLRNVFTIKLDPLTSPK